MDPWIARLQLSFHTGAVVASYDAILLVSFGGPESSDDVIPFLEYVLRGKRVPRERLLAVAEHYYHFDGVSPINAQMRTLRKSLQAELARRKIVLPVYWGNRNWHPFLKDTIEEMTTDGVQHALAWATSAFSSYSACRQYIEDIEAARTEAGDAAPQIDKIRIFFNHPRFIEAWIYSLKRALEKLPSGRPRETEIVFSAHSIPLAMAETCQYEAQLQEVCGLVASGVGIERWRLAYQSRSGPPQQPWLEPDVLEVVRQRHDRGDHADVLVAPIGFLSDHVEVLYDLDVEVQELCAELGLNYVRAATVGEHPEFIGMIADLIEERLAPDNPRPALGSLGPGPDQCPVGCCRYSPRPPMKR